MSLTPQDFYNNSLDWKLEPVKEKIGKIEEDIKKRDARVDTGEDS